MEVVHDRLRTVFPTVDTKKRLVSASEMLLAFDECRINIIIAFQGCAMHLSFFDGKKRDLPTPGIEPGPPAWKAEILTTRPRRIESEYSPEMPHQGFEDLCRSYRPGNSILVE